MWCTSVSNEVGEVLMSVLTAQEGPGIDLMVAGLATRYQDANLEPPVALYIDCGCCDAKTRERFSSWPDLVIRLDIWHFMRRLAGGCTTDAHYLYGTFMARMSSCIFEWESEDVTLLQRAKRIQLERQGRVHLTTNDVMHHITKAEMALHCRRQTRGVGPTRRLLEDLLRELDGPGGRDTLGVPLLDSARMWDIWKQQKTHLACIQDPPDVQLYTETGTLKKGGVDLKTYRCARGSTSLESFHLHLNRFIPGISAYTHFLQKQTDIFSCFDI